MWKISDTFSNLLTSQDKRQRLRIGFLCEGGGEDWKKGIKSFRCNFMMERRGFEMLSSGEGHFWCHFSSTHFSLIDPIPSIYLKVWYGFVYRLAKRPGSLRFSMIGFSHQHWNIKKMTHNKSDCFARNFPWMSTTMKIQFLKLQPEFSKQSGAQLLCLHFNSFSQAIVIVPMQMAWGQSSICRKTS